MKIRFLFWLSLIQAVAAGPVCAEVPVETEIILSASASMNDSGSGIARIEGVKRAFQKVFKDFRPGISVALRAYGSKTDAKDAAGSCKDSKLILAMKPLDPLDMMARILVLQAKGGAPAAFSLEQAAGDFSKGASKNILLVTDGTDSCGGKLSETAAKLEKADPSLTLNAVGVGLTGAQEVELRKACEITGGRLSAARTAAEVAPKLKAALKDAGLLRRRGLSGKNLLAPSEGGEIISSDSSEFIKLTDGKEEKTGAFFGGEKAVYAFQSHRPVLLEAFVLPVLDEDTENPATIELAGSLEGPSDGFYPVWVVQVPAKAADDSVYQEFKLSPPVPVRFLKITVGPGLSGGVSYLREWAAFGKPLEEDNLVKYQAQIRNRPRNLVALENGGRLISATYPEFYFLIDGTLAMQGNLAHLPVNSEAVFAFENEQAALIQKIMVPVLKPGPKNVKQMHFWVSEKSASGGFSDAGVFQIPDRVPAGGLYREFVFKKPLRAKYLKVSPTGAGGVVDLEVEIPELVVMGSFE